MTEDALVELQNSVMTNGMAHEHQFRTRQNWLRGPSRGASGVTYVPPEPELANELMGESMLLCERLPRAVDPVTAAGVLSFGFVFAFRFNGQPSVYRFWDATACVAFGHRMAEQALEHDLRG